MAKKVKKARSGQKDKRVPSASSKTNIEQGIIISRIPNNSVAGIIDRGTCSHTDKGINMDKLAAKIGNSGSPRCEDCSAHIVDSRANKGKGKHGKKGGAHSKSDSKAIWVCLECGHFACGGLGFPTTPQSHAVRHAKQNHHPLVVHYENNQLLWCFPCNKLVPEDSKHKETLKEVVKILKKQKGERSGVDVEDVWFGSGSVTSAMKSDYSVSTVSVVKVGYSVTGLVNLGNTCFFNSIMQNLLALRSLQEYLFKLDESVGPLIGSLRKFFLESSETCSKGTINPRSLFGILCTKAPQFRGYQQHDSHELLRCLLDCLSTEELSARKHTESSKASITDPTFVDAIFGGELSSTVSCLECGHSSIIYEPFLDLSLSVPTKKPPSRRIQPVAQGKKPKLLSKKPGRNLLRIGREANISPRESVSVQSANDNHLGELQSVPQRVEQILPFSGDYAFPDSVDPNAIALDMGFTVQDISTVQTLQNQQSVENIGEHSVSFDSFAWLDYLDSDPVSDENVVAPETDEISDIPGLENENVFQNDVSSSITMDSRDKSNIGTASLYSSEQDDSLSPAALNQDQDSSFSFKDKILCTQEIVPNNPDTVHNSDSCIQVFSKDSYTLESDKQNSSQVQASEVILLPSKEEASCSAEVRKPDEEQDSLDFVGLGDFFDEPEVPSSSNQPVFGPSVKNGVIGISSESDPDEVDNNDAPVSVESCLALFTKPELLTKDEHAWHCDNCSKILREQRYILSSKPKLTMSEDAENGCEDRNPSGALDVGKTCTDVKSRNGENGVDPWEEIYEDQKCMLQKHPETEINASDFQMENTEPPKIVAYHGECEPDKDEFGESDLLSAECETNLTEQEKTNLVKLKVKRDATKSILIRKAPSVLTIQLKRFNQDARGRLSKLNGHVNFRETIDLEPYMDPRLIDGQRLTYRLVGLVEHLGGMRGGHYVAYVRGDCVWYYASDAHVRQASLQEVLRCQAYILFYERT